MVAFAELDIAARTESLRTAKADLDALAVSGARAEASTGRLTPTLKKTEGAALSAAGASRILANINGMLDSSYVKTSASALGMVNVSGVLTSVLAGLGGGIGAIVGTALPALITLFFSSTAASAENEIAIRALAEAHDDLSGAIRSTQVDIDKLRFGVDEQYQVELLREQIRLYAEYGAKAQELNNYLSTTTDSIDLQRIKTADLVADIERLGDEYRSNEASLARQADRTATLAVIEGVRTQRANELADRQKRAADEAERLSRIDMSRGIQAAAVSAADLANILGVSVSLAAQLAGAGAGYDAELARTGQSSGPDAARSLQQGGGRFTPRVTGAGLASPVVAGRGGGGGGGSGGGGSGGGTDTFKSDLDALVENMQTERETIDAWYDEGQLLLADRRAMEILGEEGHREALLRVEEEYQQRLREIKETSEGGMLTQAANYFGELYSLSSNSLGKLAKLQKVAAQGQLVVDQVKAVSAIWGDASIPFFAKALAIGRVVAAFAGLRSALGGGGGGRGAGIGGGRDATAAPEQQQRIVRLDVRGEGMFADMLRKSGSAIVEAITNEQKFGGTTIVMGR